MKSGCGFYVREDIKYKPQNDLNLTLRDEYTEFRCCWIDILNEKNPNILLGVYYRHPIKNSADIFVEKLKDTLTLLRNCNKITMISGGFNYDILKHQHNSLISELLNIRYTNFLQTSILEPTRIVANNRTSLLYNIFINTLSK